MKKTTLFGTIISITWLAFFVLLLYFKRSTLDQLSLNEWGDLFGGFMAPLAFIWLVLGYIQQGEELRLNTEALKAQQEELQNQVRETAALVLNSARQAEASERMAETARSQANRQRFQSIRSSYSQTSDSNE